MTWTSAEAAPRSGAAVPAEVVAEGLLQLPCQTWSFGDSIGFEALWRYGRERDERVAAYVHGYLRAWAARAKPFVRLDCTAPGSTLGECGRATGDPLLLRAAIDLAEYLARRPTIGGVFATWERSPLQAPYGGELMAAEELELLDSSPPGVFVDCLHFDPPFFTALGRALGDERWTELGVEQAIGYLRLLQTPTGLFDHFMLDGVDGTFGPGWGRGQGWAVLGLLDVIDAIPSMDGRAEALVHAVSSLLGRMAELQRPNGHWAAVVDRPDSTEETSTAAFMAVAVQRASAAVLPRLPATSAAVVRRMGARAAGAVVRDLRPDGVLPMVSAAVNASTTPSHYVHVPTGFVVPWGQGPALLTLLEADPTEGLHQS